MEDELKDNFLNFVVEKMQPQVLKLIHMACSEMKEEKQIYRVRKLIIVVVEMLLRMDAGGHTELNSPRFSEPCDSSNSFSKPEQPEFNWRVQFGFKGDTFDL